MAQQQQQAQTLGFSAIVTKPIDLGELETKIAKAMNLDTSQRYFATEGNNLVMRLPENCSNPVLAEAARAVGIDMPIVDAVCALLAGQAMVKDVVTALLSRPLKQEGR